MDTPKRADWGEINENDLDAKWAFDTFFGKSFSEAEELFESNALIYQEDLEWMPSIPFNFYAPALVNYIASERSAGDSDGASSFLSMVAWMLKSRRALISEPTEKLLVAASEKVADRQPFYEADEEIYGNFSHRLLEIKTLLARDA